MVVKNLRLIVLKVPYTVALVPRIYQSCFIRQSINRGSIVNYQTDNSLWTLDASRIQLNDFFLYRTPAVP